MLASSASLFTEPIQGAAHDIKPMLIRVVRIRAFGQRVRAIGEGAPLLMSFEGAGSWRF